MLKERVLAMLVQEVPELKKILDERLKDSIVLLDEDGIHVIWEMEIGPCIMELLRQPEKNRTLLNQTFGLIEHLSEEQDEDMTGFVILSVLLPMRNEKEILPEAMRLMGDATKKRWNEMQDYWRQFQLWMLSQNQG